MEGTYVTRYFLAVTPPPHLLNRIEAFRARWGHPHHNVEPHVTVKPPFQWPSDDFLAPVQSACAGLQPFEVRLGAPARFGDAVLYLTVAAPALKPLHLAIIQALHPFVPADPRNHEGETYTPHLTLAVTRFGISPEGLDRMEAEVRQELADLPPFTVGAVRCYHRVGKDDRWERRCGLSLGRV